MRILPSLSTLSLLSSSVAAYVLQPPRQRFASARHMSDAWSSGDGAGRLEQIEFKIYSDGRVEETVRGIKGNNCHKVTEGINEALGEVVNSAPTEEMYEQELTQDATLYNTESSSDWDGKSSW